MPAKVSQVCAAMDALAPPNLALDGDRAGLSIGAPDWDVSHVLVTLTVTPGIVRAAQRRRADMIVSHHPVIWDPLPNLRADNGHTRMCLDLVEARIACFSVHTALDIAPGGVNAVLADRLGLRTCAPLFPVPQSGMVKLVTFVPEAHLAAVRDAVCGAGAGEIGAYTFCTFSAPGIGTFRPGLEARPFSGLRAVVNQEPERRFETLVPKSRLAPVLEAMRRAHPYEEPAYDIVSLENRDPAVGLGIRGLLTNPISLARFARVVREKLRLDYVRVVGDAKRPVQHVAVMGGSGGRRVGEIPPGIEVFVTGDVGYHDAVAASERDLALIDAGHAGTEQCVVPVMARAIRKACASLRVTICQAPDPLQPFQR